MTRRLAQRRTLIGLGLGVGTLVLATLASVAAPAPAGAGPARPERVMVVTIPRLTWDDVVDHELENLEEFLAESAVGDLSLRTVGSRTSLAEGYLSLGAGNRASTSVAAGGLALAPGERFEGGDAAESFARRTGRAPTGEVLQIAIPGIQETNRDLLYGAVPGELGSSLIDAGWEPAVVANGDAEAPRSDSEPLTELNRPAALAMMSSDGIVDRGQVRRDRLLRRDTVHPYGVRLSGDRVMEEVGEVFRDRSVTLVELSGPERADRYESLTTQDQAEAFQRQALARADAKLGRLLETTRPSDLVMVLSPAAPRSGEVPTPIAVRGPGFDSGMLVSGTTRRAGYVTISDVAPAILDQVGIEAPGSMRGAPISVRQRGDTSTERYEGFVSSNEVTDFRDATTGTFIAIFVATLVIALALTATALGRPDLRLQGPVSFLALVIIAFPAVTFGAGLVRYDRLGLGGYLVLATLLAAALAGLAELVGRLVGRTDQRRRALVPPLLLASATYGVLLIDIVTGGELQINTTFGYSPVVAGRFAGFGNTAYSLFAISSVVVATGFWGLTRRRRGAEPVGSEQAGTGSEPTQPTGSEGGRTASRRRWALAAVVGFFAMTVVADGYPSFGSDVGGVLSIIPSAAVVILLLSGRRVNLVRLGAIAAVTALVLGTFAAIDLARPVEDQTHLGRLVGDMLGSEGGSGIGTAIQRKVSANVSLFTRSTFTWTIPAALAFLVYVTRRRAGQLGQLMDRVPGTRACLWGGITMSALGYAVNDSGVAVPAVMFAILLPYLGYLLMAQPESA